MKLPTDAVIATDKVTRYFLVRQTRGDKSAFLARAGYNLENAGKLVDDLRVQLLALDATSLHSTKFGQFYEIRGPLVGPNGVTLQVRSIWMKRGFVRRHEIHYLNPGKIAYYVLRSLH